MSLDLQHLDLDKLTKGCVVKSRSIELASGISCRHENAFRLAMLAVWDAVTQHFKQRREIVSLAIHGNEIHVLTDSVASATESKRFRSYRRRMKRSHVRMNGVVTGNLTFEEKERHQRELLVQGAYVAALAAAKRTVTRMQSEQEQPR